MVREQTMQEFREFVKNRENYIAKQVGGGKSIDNIFYEDFYAQPQKKKYKTNQKPTDSYNERVRGLFFDWLQDIVSDSRKVLDILQRPWINVQINWENRPDYNDEKWGRLYLNLKPGKVFTFFKATVRKFCKTKFPIDTKMPSHWNDGLPYNRRDKMVIYFLNEHEEETLKIFWQLYNRYIDSFDDTGIPAFTLPVKDAQGNYMKGVGFGQEPVRGDSFGEIRAKKVLARVYNDARRQGKTVYDSRFDFETSFREACENFDVDYDYPSFNASSIQKPIFQILKSQVR